MGAEPKTPGNAHVHRFLKVFFAASVAIGLTGCVDTLEPSARKPLVAAPGVPVALVSLEGAPDTVIGRFQTALGSEAARREIALVQGSETPRYKLKGYLSAYDVEGGTALAWVWDMYDTSERRAKRVDGAQLVKRNSPEPWSVVDDAALQVAASSSMNEVASYLTSAPPATPAPATAQRPAAVAPAQTASATPPRAAQPAPVRPARSLVSAFDLSPGSSGLGASSLGGARPSLGASTLGLAAQ
ncbi:MAG: hypothetical protein K2P80_06430 [Beijerinckiaceae bacterium]|nr:hypothetical protein [Beijerinckiaceae bacterium]